MDADILVPAAPAIDSPPAVPVTEPVSSEPAAPAIPSTDVELATQTLETFEEKQPRRRHRAASQQASPEDVPRIRELTAKLRERDAELETLRKPVVPAVQATAEPVRATRPPVAAVPEPPAVRGRAQDPEPTAERDPATGAAYEDWNKYTRDSARWAAREELRSARESYDVEIQRATAQGEHERLSTQWTQQTTSAKALYPDFEAVAYGPSEIPSGSLVDRWIREHPSGPLVLYSLKKSPTELRAMLALPLFEQTEALALLSQRVSPRSVAAVSTGAAPVTDAKPVPRPPTPVRTGPMRTTDEPVDVDRVNLADFEKAFPLKRR